MIDTSKLFSYATDGGVQISYTKSKQRITVFAWHGIVGMHDPTTFTLREFLDRLEVSDRDLRRVLKERSR